MVDTAATWCVLEGALASVFANRDAILVQRQVISSRLGDYIGDLCRAPITLLADEGESLAVEATIFVCPEWSGPHVIGYNGLLERIRFARRSFLELVLFRALTRFQAGRLREVLSEDRDAVLKSTSEMLGMQHL